MNPVSPQQSPLGGLEALVQAATVERDRLEAKASLDRKADASRSSTVRRSPELFRSSHESSRTHLQAPAPRTPITPSLISGPPSRDPYSESSLRVGPAPETHPSKRQRQSDPHSGSDLSWDSPPSWDSSPQFTGLMGPGIKPRRQSSEVRTEIRPTLPIPSWDKEEASLAASRVSPTRERAARRQYLTEEKFSRSHVPSYREPVKSTSFAPDDSQHVFAAEEPRLTLHQDLWSNVDSHPQPPKVSRSDLLREKQVPPSSPPLPRPFFRPSEPLVPLAPAPRQQSPPPERDDRCSSQVHPPPRNDTPVPAATPAQKSVEMEVATGSEKLMESTVPSLPMQEPSVALAESLPPDSLTTTMQDSPVFITSSSSLNVYDDHPGPAVSVKSPPPASPPPDAHDTYTTPAVQVVQSPLGTSRRSSLPREGVPNPPSSEQEPCPPPTTASPSPQALSPSTSVLQDLISADQSVEHRMTSVSETGPLSLVTELQKPLDTQTSLTPIGEPEVVKSPVASFPPAVETVPLPKSDGSPGADEAPIPIEIEIKIEASPELDVAVDANQTQGTEQGHTDMDVDEELLSLIADDLPSRSRQAMPSKQEPSSSEIEHIPSDHAPLKQESALGTLPPSHPSPGPSSFNFNPEAVSTLSPFTRDSEASTPKLEERPPQKKKVNQSVLDFLIVLLTPTRQNSKHSPKVVTGQVVLQRRSSRYHPMVPRQRLRKAKSHRLLQQRIRPMPRDLDPRQSCLW